MTVSEVIEKVKDLKPNAYKDHTLLDWLNEVEAMVQKELMDTMPEGIREYRIEKDMEEELLLPRPYNALYETYNIMRIEFNQLEFTAYNNTAELFNKQYEEAQKYYNEKYPKTSKLKVKNYM